MSSPRLLYQPVGAEWERMPWDLSSAVEQYTEGLVELTDHVVRFEEWSCTKIPMPRVDWWLERLAEDICDDTWLDHDEYEHVESIIESDEVVTAAQALFDLIHSKIDYWQAGKVLGTIPVRIWPTSTVGPGPTVHLQSWDWEIVVGDSKSCVPIDCPPMKEVRIEGHFMTPEEIAEWYRTHPDGIFSE